MYWCGGAFVETYEHKDAQSAGVGGHPSSYVEEGEGGVTRGLSADWEWYYEALPVPIIQAMTMAPTPINRSRPGKSSNYSIDESTAKDRERDLGEIYRSFEVKPKRPWFALLVYYRIFGLKCTAHFDLTFQGMQAMYHWKALIKRSSSSPVDLSEVQDFVATLQPS